MGELHANQKVFDRDAEANGGYLYTTNTTLSSQLATQRTKDIILETKLFNQKSVLDIGCGDGFYSIYFWDQAQPKRLVGLDVASSAIEVANANKKERPIEFITGDSHQLPYPDNSFDVVSIQSILHHDDDPLATIKEALRVAPQILIHEPNGYNFGLKVIEKVSRYHREHGEKSFTTRLVSSWITQAGGKVTYRRFAGFVPMFCSDRVAHVTKFLEPAVETVPIVKMLGCAVYVLVAARV